MGKSEVELKKQSKTKRRKNQKMELKEKWICPDAEVQLFTPQEYVAACYRITVNCASEGWILVGNTATQHTGNHSTTFNLSSNSYPITDSQVRSIMSSKYSWTSSRTSSKENQISNTHSGQSTGGYRWLDEGTWHFTTENGTWFDSTEIPNVS
ncbi:MAG: hypothetical protein IJ726_06500 [Phocaeicola sp.]|nr:hypothetical protein [Phocaeicola sp.]